MLVQVKHRGGVFKQSFYYKYKGGFAKIKAMSNNKVQKQTYNNCFYSRHMYPEVRKPQYPLQYQNYIQLLLISNYHNTRLFACKFFTSSRTTPGNTESFTPDYTMQNNRNIKNILKNTNNNYLILRKYQGNNPKYLRLNKYLKLQKKGKYNG